ncbi:4,5-DOPA dioxygenase extradiol [Arcobacter sp.]|uniref:4,5-DOPA-extradiol-dioxygenase n=1 Tax=unclassified Arcobacter TaxID=2593671 RepID=UPI003B009651
MSITRRKFTYLAGISTLLATLPSWAKESTKITPALFIGHGTPMNAFVENRFTKEWEKIAQIIKKPKAILVVSAHWETMFPAVSTAANPETIYDYYGFPEFMYEFKYPAPGTPKIAKHVSETFKEEVFNDPIRGLDHGAWTVLSRLFPKADVPVFEFSLAQSMTPKEHFLLAKEMYELRKQGIMIIGSGNIVHNIPSAKSDTMHGTRDVVHDWAKSFDEKVTSKIDSGDYEALVNYQEMGKDALMAVPSPEHFLPLLYVLGCVKKDEQHKYFAQGFQEGSFSMRSVLFS